MKTALVSVESGITAIGFRRIAAVARQLDPETGIFFCTTDSLYSPLSQILSRSIASRGLSDADIANIAWRLSSYDLVCIAGMSASSSTMDAIIARIRAFSPKAFILYGGVHPIIYSEDALAVADAISYAEGGEIPFEMFWRAFSEGRDYRDVPGMAFKDPSKLMGGIRKNPSLPLNTNAQLASFPHIYYGLDCDIYDASKGAFRQLTHRDHCYFNGLAYRTVWSLGCPYHCTFCANDAFIAADKTYTKLRYPSPEFMVREIELAIERHPYISTVAFYDDNLIVLPLAVLREFATLYKERIGLPFVVFGVHPNLITDGENIRVLCEAGMNRVRMGIQSGSERMLKFYERGTKVSKIKSSVSVLAAAARKYKMIPPAYDVITDNPEETRQDVVDTLQFFYDLERPFTLTVFGLRVFPKTKLWEYFAVHKDGGDPRSINSSYLDTRPTVSTLLLYLLGTCKPPRWMFDWMLARVHGVSDPQPEYPRLHLLFKTVYLVKRGLDHLFHWDFTAIVGAWTIWAWRLNPAKQMPHRHRVQTEHPVGPGASSLDEPVAVRSPGRQ